MSLRSLLALLLSVTLVLAFGFLYVSSRYLEERIVSLLPSSYGSQVAMTIHLLIFGQLGLLMVFALAASIFIFFAVSLNIVSPLRRIIKAMRSFAETGKKSDTQRHPHTLHEIRELEDGFADLTIKVEELHNKDSEISRVKSDFISTAAHQLRTPLTGIRWALEALQKEQLSEFQQTLVKNALDKSHDLVAIVGTLLDISSIESGKYKYQFAPTDISVITEQVVQDFEPMAQKSNVSLIYEKSAKPLPTVRADQVRIKWVLNNLIENAIRYTPSGGAVRVTAELAPGRVFIHVHDTGIGILPQDRANIFERFYRAGNAIAKENQGNGLGLYIARTIATDHGGDLNFEANSDSPGSTFTLSLPVA